MIHFNTPMSIFFEIFTCLSRRVEYIMSSIHRVRRRLGVELLPWGVAESRTIEKLLELKAGERLLEAGCSSGYRIERYAKPGVELWGIDADKGAIVEGRKSGSGVNLIEGDAQNLPFRDLFFDKVLTVHLLEHLGRPRKAIQEMARVLKPEGSGVIVVPCERLRGDTAFAGWLRLVNLHKHRFTPPKMYALLSPHFTIERAIFHTIIPGKFKPVPLDRTPFAYYFSLAMIFKVRKSG